MTDLKRLLLVYGIPAAIVAVTLLLNGMLFQRAPGAPNSTEATLFFGAGFGLALVICFVMHFKTRRW
jgi:hypothetical protein